MIKEMKETNILWLGSIPLNWQLIHFRHLHNGTNVGEAIDKVYWSSNESDIVFYTAGLNPISTTYTDFPQEKYTKENDLLLARNGTPYVYLPVCNAAYTDHIIRVSIKKGYDKRFVRYSLSQSILYEIVDTVSLVTWSASIWNRQCLPIPSYIEQCAIADFLDNKCEQLDALISTENQMIEKLREYKQSVITEAVTKGIRGERPIKDSGIEWIGKIPEEWKIIRLKFVCKLFGRIGYRGYTTDDLVGEGEGAITLSPSNFNDMKMDYSHCSYLSWDKYNESPEIQIHNGDILFVKTGSTYGKSCIVRDLPLEATINPQSIVIKDISICTDYLGYVLNSKMISAQVDNTVVGGTIPTIAQSKIENYFFTLPTSSEQQEIADFLNKKCSEIDELVAIKQSKIYKLQEYKKSLIYEYVTGKKEIC